MGDVIAMPKPSHKCANAPGWVELKEHGSSGWCLLVPMPPGVQAAAAVVRVQFCPWCGERLGDGHR